MSGRESLNKRLEQLYRSKVDDLQAMYAELRELVLDDCSWPLLLHVWEEDYAKAPVKLMFVGQETMGWEAPFNTEEEVASSMAVYERFGLGQDYKKTPFWSWVHSINQKFGNPDTNCFVWNNILKFGKEAEKGRPDSRITDLENEYFNVIKDEMAILGPDVCLFLTGPTYDDAIRAKFPDVEFMLVEDYPLNEVARLKGSGLPEHAYRTYHPGYGQRHSDWYSEVFETIAKSL